MLTRGSQTWSPPQRKVVGFGCLDARLPNKAIIPHRYPLPTPEKLTAQFYGSKVFTKLDLHQGYLQVPLHPASRDSTGFNTHMGVFSSNAILPQFCAQLLSENHVHDSSQDPLG